MGVPDRYFGEDAVAFVVLRSAAAADERELLAFCESRLGHFKTPSRIHFLKELPKGPSGKVQRLRLLDPAVLSGIAGTTQFRKQSTTHAMVAAPGMTTSLRRVRIQSSKSLPLRGKSAWGARGRSRHANFFALGGHSLLSHSMPVETSGETTDCPLDCRFF